MKSRESEKLEPGKDGLTSRPVKLLEGIQASIPASEKGLKNDENIYYKNGITHKNTSKTSTGTSKGHIHLGRRNPTSKRLSIQHFLGRINENLGALRWSGVHDRQESRSGISRTPNNNLRRRKGKRIRVPKRRRYISMTNGEAKLLETLLHVALICYLIFSLINSLERYRYDFLMPKDLQLIKWTGTP